jgi:site-specific recombinase XerD
MSEKLDLLDMPGGRKVAGQPYCSADIALRFMRKEKIHKKGLTKSFPDERTGARRIQAFLNVQNTMSSGIWKNQYQNTHCEPYLREAVYRWLVSSCRSLDAINAYTARLAKWIAWSGKRSLSAQVNTNPGDVSEFLFRLEADGLAARTIVHHRDVLRSWFRWLYDRDLIHRTPITRDILRGWRVDHQAVKKANGRRQSLSLAEAQQVARWCLTTAQPEAGLSVMLQMVGGLRSDEVANLERRHIVEREGIATLTVPGKGNKSRQIVLEPAIVAAWHRYLRRRRRQGERGPLLVRPGGGHYDRRQVQRWAKQAAAVVGRANDISSHDLRKTALTLLVEAGADLASVRDVAGHSDLRLTERCYVTRKPALDVTTGVQPLGPPTAPAIPTQSRLAGVELKSGDSRPSAPHPSDTPRQGDACLQRISRPPHRPAGPPSPPTPDEGGALGNQRPLLDRKFPKLPQEHPPVVGAVSPAGDGAW